MSNPRTSPSGGTKILYDEGETSDGMTIWQPYHRPTTSRRLPRGRRVCCVAILAVLTFFLGVSVGAYLHATVFPDPADSPIFRISSLLMTSETSSEVENSENSTFIELEPELEKEDEIDENRECSNLSWYSSRLPKWAVPTEYQIWLHPNLTTEDVQAKVTIRITVLNDTKLLIVNAESLEMEDFRITRNGEELEAEFIKCEIMTQWAWKLDEWLKIGDFVELSIDYRLEMHSDLQGLYLSTHIGSDGTKTKSAATQFEPTFARKMLPCFDEPNFKATFQVSIVRDPDHIARSNTNLRTSKEFSNSNLIVDEFDKSVKMSTYLLAVAVLDGYSYKRRITRNTRNNIEVRIYAPQDSLEGQYELGLDTTIRALEFFEEYFNSSYPLDKIDLLALDDFSEGAMENWGLVTFRDSALLFDEKRASVVAKEQIALIICHEIAHQWFGNLVTMDWWNEVFLNEGFANYMEYKCVDSLFPDWEIMTRFYAENLAFSQEPDGLLGSRPIESDDDDSLMNLFDAINYHKAAAIIHMIAEMAGQHNFRTALVEYLDKYKYQNAKGVHLWTIIEKHANLQSRISIPEVARAYTTQTGYPIIRVQRLEKSIKIDNQTRFLFAENSENGNRGDWKWPVPVSYRTFDNPTPKLHWLTPTDENVTWETTSASPIIVNTGGVGYFKVQYDADNYSNLVRQLSIDHSKISPIDRSMILVDAYDLSKTSLLNISTYLDLVEYAENETDKMAWSIISRQLKTIESLIENSESTHHLFQDFERSLIIKLYDSLDWDEQEATPTERRLQVEVFGVACRLKIRDCTKHAYNMYLKWINSGVRTSEHHLISLLEGIRQGGLNSWERIWKAYKTSNNPSVKNNILGALASTRDVTLVNRLLKYCLDGKIKPNLIPRVFSALSVHQIGRDTAWKYFRQHFEQFHEIMGKGSTLMAACVKCLSEPLSSQQELDDLKQFLKSQKFEDDGQIKMEQTYEQIELNIQWRRLNEQELANWIIDWDSRRKTFHRRKRHRHY